MTIAGNYRTLLTPNEAQESTSADSTEVTVDRTDITVDEDQTI